MFYLFDRLSNKVRASYLDMERAPFQNFRVVQIPTDVPIDEENLPLTYASILQQKYDGILARNPQFANVFYDDLTSDTTWNLIGNWRGSVGDGVFFLSPLAGSSAGMLETLPFDASSLGIFDRVAPYWDVYQVSRTQIGQQIKYTYTPVDADVLDAQVSVDGGATFVSALNLQEVTFLSAGDQLVVRLVNNSPTERYYLGGVGILF